MKNDEINVLQNDLFEAVIKQYVSSLNSQYESLPIIMNALFMKLHACESKMRKFLSKEKEHIETHTSEDGEITYSIPTRFYFKFTALKEECDNSSIALMLTPKNAVVALVGIYDAYIGNLIKTVYKVKPELLNACKREFQSTELLRFTSIDDIKDYIIDKEVECVLRESHEEQLKWFKKMDIKISDKDLPHLKDFIEITERRNLYVHCDGKISEQYLNVCKEHNISVEGLQKGAILNADGEYLTHCYNILFEIGFKLGQVVWRKINIGLNKCDEQLQDVTFDLIKNRQYDLASILLDFATQKSTKHAETVMELVFCVNKALSYYLQDKKDKCNKIILDIDWSAYDNKYKLARAVLLEKFDEAATIMKQIGKNEEFISNYRNWPLFRVFREMPIFIQTYKEIYGADFEYEEQKKVHWSDVIDESQIFIEQLKEELTTSTQKESKN